MNETLQLPPPRMHVFLLYFEGFKPACMPGRPLHQITNARATSISRKIYSAPLHSPPFLLLADFILSPRSLIASVHIFIFILVVEPVSFFLRGGRALSSSCNNYRILRPLVLFRILHCVSIVSISPPRSRLMFCCACTPSALPTPFCGLPWSPPSYSNFALLI